MDEMCQSSGVAVVLSPLSSPSGEGTMASGTNGQSSPGTHRPLVPPKPKKSVGATPPSSSPPSPGKKSTTVGTQVNLLGKTSPSSKPRKSNHCDSINIPSTKLNSSLSPSPLSPNPGLKPALPPKPSPNSLPPQINRSRRESLEKPLQLPLSSSSSQGKSSPPPIPTPTTTTTTIEELNNLYESIDEINERNGDPPPRQHKSPLTTPTTGTGTGITTNNTNNKKKVFQFPNPSPQSPSGRSGTSGIGTKPSAVPILSTTTSHFTPLSSQSKIAAQRKSTSLNRNINFSSFLKYPHHISPLNLHSSTTKTMSSISHSIFDNRTTASTTSGPPSPPPRLRRHSVKPIGNLNNSISLPITSSVSTPSSPTRTPQSAPVCSAINPPIYAVVDKEKKWQERKLKEEEEKTVAISDGTNNNVQEPEPDSAQPESPSPKGWLNKFIIRPDSGVETSGTGLNLPPTPPSSTTNETSPSQNDSFLFNYSFTSQNSSTISTNEHDKDQNPDLSSNSSTNLPLDKSLTLNLKSENFTDDDLTPTVENPKGLIMGDPEIDFEDLVDNQLESMKESETLIRDTAVGDLVSEIILSQEQFSSPTKDKSRQKEVNSTEPNIKLRSSITSSSIKYRRRSWSCSETCSSFSDSPPSSSSSGSLKDRTSSFSGSNNSNLVWNDEGDLPAGVLGDGESSDAGHPTPHNRSYPGSVNSSFSKRRRFVANLFNSFGKSREKYSSSSSGNREPANVKRKDKIKSQFYTMDNSSNVLAKTKKTKVHIQEVRNLPSKNNNHKPTVKSLSLPRFSDVPSLSSLESFNFSPTSSFSNDHDTSDPGPGVIGSLIQDSPQPGEGEDEECNVSLAPSSGPSSLSTYDDILRELPTNERLRFYVARELLTSERTFVDVLNLLTVDFVKELEIVEIKLGHPVIHSEDLNIILGGLPTLKKVNEELLNALEERISDWKSQPKVSDIINKYGPFLKHYSSYIRDYQKNKKHFDLCRNKNPRFQNIVHEFENGDRCKNLRLEHYMLKPIQRMPQYSLLLGDYLKHLDPESSDYADTVKAIGVVKDVAEHGNEAIRRQENSEKLVLLQHRLPNTEILKADRRLVKEGELWKVCRKENQPRYFALMSDSLFCMTYTGGVTAGYSKELKLRYELPLTGMRVVISQKEDLPNEFTITSVQRSFSLVAKTSKERDEWVRELDGAIKRNIKRRADVLPEIYKEMFQIGKVAPVWIPDKRVTMCQACTAEFTVTFRRHHCRACGKVVCGSCSGNEAPLQYKNNESARVCDDCYTYLLEEFDKENLENAQETGESLLRSRFRRGTNISKRATKHKKSIPSRLEVNANSSGSALSGYLQWKEYRHKAWKRQWFVLMPDGVLYVYAASEDIAAIKSIPLLGYQVEYLSSSTNGGEEHEDKIFQVTHSGQDPYIFQADSTCTAEKWLDAMKKATVLDSTTSKILETEEKFNKNE